MDTRKAPLFNRDDVLRTRIFRPYLAGPTFRLRLYYVGGDRIGYVLTQFDGNGANGREIFEGADFRPSPLHAIDSDETVRALMTFLTLRPGDTDAEYFDSYTPEQRDFAATHAEALSLYALEPEAI